MDRPRHLRPRASAETGTNVAPSVESAESVVPFAGGSRFPAASTELSTVRDQRAAADSSIAGVALPQSLPEGTQIGVSVDYKINGGLKSSRFVLVIESSAGQITVPVKLSPMGGTLAGFLPAFRPPRAPAFPRPDRRVPGHGQSRPGVKHRATANELLTSSIAF